MSEIITSWIDFAHVYNYWCFRVVNKFTQYVQSYWLLSLELERRTLCLGVKSLSRVKVELERGKQESGDGNAVSSCSRILHWGINQDSEREGNALDAQRDGVYTEFEGQISGWMDEAYHTIELNSQLNLNYKISFRHEMDILMGWNSLGVCFCVCACVLEKKTKRELGNSNGSKRKYYLCLSLSLALSVSLSLSLVLSRVLSLSRVLRWPRSRSRSLLRLSFLLDRPLLPLRDFRWRERDLQETRTPKIHINWKSISNK